MSGAGTNEGVLPWLMHWYVGQCDGEWEHPHGIEIVTLDNPGWRVRVDLDGTALAGRSFSKTAHGEPASRLEEWTGSWWVAEVKDGVFEGACGPLDLPVILDLFRQWADAGA